MKLQKPGAGLPWPERWAVRYFIGPYFSHAPWEQSKEVFESEGKKIAELLKAVPSEHLTTPILIERIRGLEDSSRYWSVAMTLEHLMIVGRGIGQIVKTLANENKVQAIVDTALVKPSKNDPNALEEFLTFYPNYAQDVFVGSGKKSETISHIHPWFGPFNSRQWFWLLGMHQGLHRRQIELVLQKLA